MSARKLLACWTPLVLAFLCLGVGEVAAQVDPSRLVPTLVATYWTCGAGPPRPAMASR